MIESNERVKGSARAVELIDKADARHAVLIGLTPDRFGLRLDARDAVKHSDRAVEHAQDCARLPS